MSSPTRPGPGGPLSTEDDLRRIFDEQFSTLAREAKSSLSATGTDAAPLASRAVESAFLHVWEQRRSLQSAGDVRSALQQDVKESVDRLLERRAANTPIPAGRSADDNAADVTAGGEIDAARSWKRITGTIHERGHSVGALAASAEVARHGAAHHMEEVGEEKSLKWPIAIGVVGLIAVGIAFFAIDRASAPRVLTQAVAAKDVREVKSAKGQMGDVTLSDSTVVHLAPDSRLIIPNRFGVKLRGVGLQGLATFTVKSASDPFMVAANGAVVSTAAGTVVVRAYPGEPVTLFVAQKGSAEARLGDNEQTIGEGTGKAVIQGNVRDASPSELESATGWLSSRLAFSGATLQDAIAEMRRWYGYQIDVADATLLARPVTMHARIDSAQAAIAQVQQSANVRFYSSGGRYLVGDAKAP